MNIENNIGVYKDLSSIDSMLLIKTIMQQKTDAGLDFILPDEKGCSAEELMLQSRLQRVQDVPQLSPQVIADKIITNNNKIKSSSLSSQVHSIDELVNKRRQSLMRGNSLNELDLSKTEQILFLRGVVLAISARESASLNGGRVTSETQKKIQVAALNHIRHLATNLVYVSCDQRQNDPQRFADAYATAYLAKVVENELYQIRNEGSHGTRSILDAMSLPIQFGLLRSGNQDDVVSIFPPSHENASTPSSESRFSPKLPAEIDDKRIQGLRGLQASFGDAHVAFRYYETVKPFDRTGQRTTKGDPSVKNTKKNSNTGLRRDEVDEVSYVILEIEQIQEDGSIYKHVVAENPQEGNACYALREEIIDEWERLIGVRFSWRDIFSLSRAEARQLGARRFVHSKGSDVPSRVRKYLQQDDDSMIYETFSSIFDKEADLFNTHMQPTQKNNMPQLLLQAIERSEVLQQLWPAIQEHGYKNTFIFLRAMQRGELSINSEIESVRAHRVPLRLRAAEMWKQILAQQENTDSL